MSDKLDEILQGNRVNIDDRGIIDDEHVLYAEIVTQMGGYQFCINYNGEEKDFVQNFICELDDFDAVSNALDEIQNGCIAETDDIRWYADAADELEEAVNELNRDLKEYSKEQGW